MNNDNGQARGNIFLLARQEGKVICFGRPLSKYMKMISDDHYMKNGTRRK